MKKVLLAILLVVSMLILAACEPGYISGELNINDSAGGGTKSIWVEILRDGAIDYDGNVVEGQADLFPNGVEALKDKLIEVSPLEDLEVTLTEGEDSDFITLTYSFKDIDEYNEKSKKMADAAGMDYIPATLTESEGQYIFEEDAANFRSTIQWALEAIYYDPEIFEPGENNTIDTWVEYWTIMVNVGDESDEFDLGRWVEDPPATFTLTGALEPPATPEPTEEPSVEPTEDPTVEPTPEPTDEPSAEPTPEPTEEPSVEPTEEPSVEPTENPTEEPTEEPTEDPTKTPKTGDNGIVLFAVAILLSSIVLFGFRKRIFN